MFGKAKTMNAASVSAPAQVLPELPVLPRPSQPHIREEREHSMLADVGYDRGRPIAEAMPVAPGGEGMRMAGPTTPVRSRSVRTRGNRGTTPPPPGRRRLGGITGTFWSFRTGNGSRSDPGAWPAAWRPPRATGIRRGSC